MQFIYDCVEYLLLCQIAQAIELSQTPAAGLGNLFKDREINRRSNIYITLWMVFKL